jgi:hypothetical protein
MNIDKDQILELLRSQGKHDEARQASRDLPDKVDTDDESHQSVLSKFGVDPSEIGKTLGFDKFM